MRRRISRLMSRIGRNSPARSTSALMLIGFSRVRESAGLGEPVVLLDVLARAGDGEQVEECEVVEAEHLDQAGRRALGFVEVEPAVELLLCKTRGAVDAADAVIEQSRVVAFGGEGDLVAQVGQAVVDRRGREHEHTRLDALLDDLAHQAVVASLAPDSRRLLVAEVVRLVDDDEVVVAPVDVGEVDVAGETTVAGQVGVVQDVVVEAIGRQEVAAVVGLVERPVVAQPLGDQDQHAIVAQLVVLDDGERLEGLPEADAVGDDAAAEAVELVDRSDDAVALELVELLPDNRVADAGGRLDDLFFVECILGCAEEMVEDESVRRMRRTVRRQRVETIEDALLLGGLWREARPLRFKPRAQELRFSSGLGCLDQVERISWRNTEPCCGERNRTVDDPLRFTLRVARNEGPLRDRRCCWPQVHAVSKP